MAFRYAAANSQAYTNANGQCLRRVILFSCLTHTALDNFTITGTNSKAEYDVRGNTRPYFINRL